MTGHYIVGIVFIVASLLVWGMAFAVIAYTVYCVKEIIKMGHSAK